jgi:hypothetical protein
MAVQYFEINECSVIASPVFMSLSEIAAYDWDYAVEEDRSGRLVWKSTAGADGTVAWAPTAETNLHFIAPGYYDEEDATELGFDVGAEA